jgi:hypothetical protein
MIPGQVISHPEGGGAIKGRGKSFRTRAAYPHRQGDGAGRDFSWPPGMEQFSALTGDIYDASLDPASWPAVFEQVCGFVHASTAHLFAQDSVSKAANGYFSWGDDPNFTRLYLDKYAELNPMWRCGARPQGHRRAAQGTRRDALRCAQERLTTNLS